MNIIFKTRQMEKKLNKIPVVIFSVSGHAKVILDIIESGNSYELLGFIDNETPIGTNILGYKV